MNNTEGDLTLQDGTVIGRVLRIEGEPIMWDGVLRGDHGVDEPTMLVTFNASTPFLAQYLVLGQYEKTLLTSLEYASKFRTEEDVRMVRALGDRIKECHALMRSAMDEHMSCIAHRIRG